MGFASKRSLCLPHVIKAIVFSRSEHNLTRIPPTTPRCVQLAATQHTLFLPLEYPLPLGLAQSCRNVHLVLVSLPNDAPTLGLRLRGLGHPQNPPRLLLEGTSNRIFILGPRREQNISPELRRNRRSTRLQFQSIGSTRCSGWRPRQGNTQKVHIVQSFHTFQLRLILFRQIFEAPTRQRPQTPHPNLRGTIARSTRVRRPTRSSLPVLHSTQGQAAPAPVLQPRHSEASPMPLLLRHARTSHENSRLQRLPSCATQNR